MYIGLYEMLEIWKGTIKENNEKSKCERSIQNRSQEMRRSVFT